MTSSEEIRECAPQSLNIHYFANFCHEAGTYFRFHNLAAGLVKHGHRVTVFTCDFFDKGWKTRTELRNGVTYVIQPQHFLAIYLFNACDPVTVSRRLLSKTPSCDIAHLFQPFPGAALPWLRAPCRARFYDWDDLWIGGLMSGPVDRWRDYWPRTCVGYLEQRLPRWADHVTAISRYLAALARERGARAVSVVNSGSWPLEASDKLATRRELGLQSDAFYVGFMGRTTAELPWCVSALAANAESMPKLRLALCGMPTSDLNDIPEHLRSRIDYLGQLTPTQAQAFSSCLDLALLPMQASNFNQSRLPQKFADYLATGVPLLCSAVGECAELIPKFPWVRPAGATQQEWEQSFTSAIDHVRRNAVPKFDRELFERNMSWVGLSKTLAQIYLQVLESKKSSPVIKGRE
ncbi:MAG: hypothetical protein C0483_17490 [Pirellula sp.]|nr:hypothetical protein [Pirellula sp.]